MSEQFNAEIGEEYKEKMREIAESNHRDMTGQLKSWIDENYPPAKGDA
jgi:hypothetical protein